MSSKYDACAELLQFPLIGDSVRFTCVIDPARKVRIFDQQFTSPDVAFGRVQTNGVGDFCRWMLTDVALIIRFLDGTYWEKERPEGLFSGGSAYNRIFSFQAGSADIIVVCMSPTVFVLRVSNGVVEEESLSISAHLYCGFGSSDAEYFLFGQSLRSDLGESGQPLIVSAKADRFMVQDATLDVGASIEGIMAALACNHSATLICSESPPPLTMYDFEWDPSPGATDHENFWVVPWPKTGSVKPTRIEGVRYLGAGGVKGNQVSYFQDQKNRHGSDVASMICISADGVPRYLNVQGLHRDSTIWKVQYDPLFGWLGVASEFSGTRDSHLMLSKDGLEWASRRIDL
ncbi:hypothetical protein [Achromobacter sp. 413638]|uniref:hypothetical protein n=1 Tax=Achromobacter sp. 413638 TaxID=3342385 RepID=UPI00370A674F